VFRGQEWNSGQMKDCRHTPRINPGGKEGTLPGEVRRHKYWVPPGKGKDGRRHQEGRKEGGSYRWVPEGLSGRGPSRGADRLPPGSTRRGFAPLGCPDVRPSVLSYDPPTPWLMVAPSKMYASLLRLKIGPPVIYFLFFNNKTFAPHIISVQQ
jgi:hypothetical protein